METSRSFPRNAATGYSTHAPPLASMERAIMSTVTPRIASAFVVLFGRYGDVTKMAHDREQSRQSLYREASQVANAVDGTQSSPASTNSSSNSPSGRPRSKPSKID